MTIANLDPSTRGLARSAPSLGEAKQYQETSSSSFSIKTINQLGETVKKLQENNSNTQKKQSPFTKI